MRRRLALVSIAAFLASGASCSACTVWVPMEVQTVQMPDVEVSLSLGELKSIIGAANTLLQDSTSSTDVACDAGLTYTSLKTVNGPTSVIQSQTDFDALFLPLPAPPPGAGLDEPLKKPLLRQVRVVFYLGWCGGVDTVAGCADQPGLRIALERRNADREGILWGHEVGHTRNLGHREYRLALMYPTILPDHFELDSNECGLYRR